MRLQILSVFLLLSCAMSSQATQIYQTQDNFIHSIFGDVPKPRVIWLDDALKQQIESILAHSFQPIRLRYWQQQQDTIWVLEEIGKESPITVGIHIRQTQLQQIKVLVYRESRGDEVRHAFFTDQFKAAELTDSLELNKHIDGITGATLSVRALTKLSRIALLLHNKVINGDNV